MCGALALFGDGAKVLKISVPSDFSVARLNNLPLGSTPSSVAQLLSQAKFIVPTTHVRIIPRGDGAPGCAATVWLEDPSFSGRLSNHLSTKEAIPRADRVTAKPINATLPQEQGENSRRVDCNKIHLSWHKPSRTVWLNFRGENDADKVKSGYICGDYKVLGQTVKCTGPTQSGGDSDGL